jgi:predicted DNA-binding protein (MmcQ/YjbR family)
MDIDSIRKHCMGFPHATENVQWGADLCFKVEGKMFAVASLEVGPVRLSFKCTPENFAELCERQGIIPAPYLARAQWVALKSLSAVPDAELRELLAESYWLVWQRLPKGRRVQLTIPPVVAVKTASSKKKKAAPSSPAKRTKKAAKGRKK